MTVQKTNVSHLSGVKLVPYILHHSQYFFLSSIQQLTLILIFLYTCYSQSSLYCEPSDGGCLSVHFPDLSLLTSSGHIVDNQ